MKLPQLLAVFLLLAPFAALAGQNSPETAFALASPKVAEGLRALASKPEALAAIEAAHGRLALKPDAIPVMHTEGTLPHQGIYDQSKQASADLDHVLDFALAYRLTGDAAYLQATDRFLSAWLTTYKIGFDPIDETHFDRFILAYDLTRDQLPPATQAQMKTFLTTMAQGYLDGIKKKAADFYNWQSHRVKLATLAAFALGDDALIEQAHQCFLTQLSHNILPDGEVADFHKRDALHYVTYDLEPLLLTALAAKAHGLDWFHPASASAASLPAALDWLTPYALGQKTHEEFVHSSVLFDAKRAKAGVPGFSGAWEPSQSSSVYQTAALLDPKYQTVYDRVLKAPGARGAGWIKLLGEAGL